MDQILQDENLKSQNQLHQANLKYPKMYQTSAEKLSSSCLKKTRMSEFHSSISSAIHGLLNISKVTSKCGKRQVTKLLAIKETMVKVIITVHWQKVREQMKVRSNQTTSMTMWEVIYEHIQRARNHQQLINEVSLERCKVRNTREEWHRLVQVAVSVMLWCSITIKAILA